MKLGKLAEYNANLLVISQSYINNLLEIHIILSLESNERTSIYIFGEVIMNGDRKYGISADVAFVS